MDRDGILASLRPDWHGQLIDMLYSVPSENRRRSHWVMSSEWRDKLIRYAERNFPWERPPAHPTELLGRPFVIDAAAGFPALVIPDEPQPA